MHPTNLLCALWLSDDVLRARLKTVGVSEYRFQIEAGPQSGSEWRIVDVGGSRFQVRVFLISLFPIIKHASSHGSFLFFSEFRVDAYSDVSIIFLWKHGLTSVLTGAFLLLATWVPFFDDGEIAPFPYAARQRH